MSMGSMDICGALEWYRTYLVSRRGVAKRDLQRKIQWLEHFCEALPRKTVSIENIGVRDVVVYFADQSMSFKKPLEWYSRYKVIETFWDDMVTAKILEYNVLKGIYDDTDVEPYVQENPSDRIPMVPVNWSRVESLF